MSRISQLALKLSYERVPETCPALHTAAVKAIAEFSHWAAKTRWFDKLTRSERHEFENRVTAFSARITDGAKEDGTVLLRAALVREIEDHLLTGISAERIASIEAGEDLNVSELFPSA